MFRVSVRVRVMLRAIARPRLMITASGAPSAAVMGAPPPRPGQYLSNRHRMNVGRPSEGCQITSAGVIPLQHRT